MKNLYAEPKRRLAAAFFRDNFDEVARLAEEGSWQTDRPLGLYVLSCVLFALSDDWPRQGIKTSVAEEMRRSIQPVIAAFLDDASSRDLTIEEEVARLNDIVRSFLKWRSTR